MGGRFGLIRLGERGRLGAERGEDGAAGGASELVGDEEGGRERRRVGAQGLRRGELRGDRRGQVRLERERVGCPVGHAREGVAARAGANPEPAT